MNTGLFWSTHTEQTARGPTFDKKYIGLEWQTLHLIHHIKRHLSRTTVMYN